MNGQRGTTPGGGSDEAELAARAAGLLPGRIEEFEDDDNLDPACEVCGRFLGITLGYGKGWFHYRRKEEAGPRYEPYDAGHEPVVAWREGGTR